MAIFGRRGDPVGSPGSEKPASLRSHAQPPARDRSGAIYIQLRSLLDFRLTEQWSINTRKAHPWGGLDIKSVCVVTPPLL